MRRRRKITALAAVFAVVVVALVAGWLSQRDSEEGAADLPVDLPSANSANFTEGETITVFDQLVIPRPRTWSGAMSEPEFAVSFIDTMNCPASGSQAECPKIDFINLASDQTGKYFGDDPFGQWADTECLVGPRQPLEGPTEFVAGGVDAEYYRIQCGPESEYNNYAWLIPDKDLLVVGYAGKLGIVSPEIVQAALEQAAWQ